jgi:hypothetical protein
MEIPMRTLATVLMVAAAATAVRGQGHETCPMKGKAGHRQAEVDHRHQHTTGVPTEGTRHHFLLAKDGGSIRLGVVDEGRTAARDAIRAHLQAIARAFAAGDFSMPMQIHDQVPPGVEAMKAHGAAIRYGYSESPDGGVVTISTQHADAVSAIHEFLRFQIADHGTGDPAE